MYTNFKYEKQVKLSREDIIKYIEGYQTGVVTDHELELLIGTYSSLIKKIVHEQAKRYRIERNEDNLEELYNYGVIGLLRGFKVFNKDKANKFANYFYRYISSEISSSLVKTMYGIKYSEEFALHLSTINYSLDKEEQHVDKIIDGLKASDKTKKLLKDYYMGVGDDTEFDTFKSEEPGIEEQVNNNIQIEKLKKVIKELKLTEKEKLIFETIYNNQSISKIYPIVGRDKKEIDETYEGILKMIKFEMTR